MPLLIDWKPQDFEILEEGVLVAPQDAGALAEAIARIIDGQLDWSALHRQARQRHRERFSDAAMASGVARVYQRVLKERG